jgi:4-diphosphocytidyl-2-C-methyl-D-erythritol kinase
MIRLSAPAKLTLSLSITGVRPDGFHLIDAEMVSLDIADEVVIAPADSTAISVVGPYAAGVPTNESNLVYKALTLAQRTADVHIVKNIPHGGGLGGGSTDAAAVLRWAGFTNVEAAAALGADIAFCLNGGRARVTGIGDILEPLAPAAQDITLFIPPVHVSTPTVYKQWDSMGGPIGDNKNDLEPAALQAYPELAQWRDHIEAVSGHRPLLAGSGATWFIHGHQRRLTGLSDKVQVVYTVTQPR